MTHSNVTDEMDNIPLFKNPNLQDNNPSYFRPFGDEDQLASFGKKEKGWKLHPDDKVKIPIKKANNRAPK